MRTVRVSETACHVFGRFGSTQAELSKEQEHRQKGLKAARTGAARDAYGTNVTGTISEHVRHWLECFLSKNLAVVCTMSKNRVEFQCIFTDKKGREIKNTLFGFQRDSMILSVLRQTVKVLLSSVLSQPLTDSKTAVKKQRNLK